MHSMHRDNCAQTPVIDKQLPRAPYQRPSGSFQTLQEWSWLIIDAAMNLGLQGKMFLL